MSDPAAVARLFETAQPTLGGLDALVNNAGIAGPTAPCVDIALADWERTLAVNLTGQFLCAQHAIPLLKASANASIANLSSAAGRFGFPNRTPYAARKWGVIGFTKSLSIELGGFGIRVNAICPGAVAGARIDHVFASKAKLRDVHPDVVRDETLAQDVAAPARHRRRHRERDRVPGVTARRQHLRPRAAGGCGYARAGLMAARNRRA